MRQILDETCQIFQKIDKVMDFSKGQSLPFESSFRFSTPHLRKYLKGIEMIDMGQADKGLRVPPMPPAPFNWAKVKFHPTANRGDICVVRSSNGTPEALKIEPQTAYKEWSYCFSLI